MTDLPPLAPELDQTIPLFPLPPDAVLAAVAARMDQNLSADQRLTLTRLAMLEAGWHPVEKGPLHDDAAPAGDRKAPGLRCRTCAHLTPRGDYLKCGLIPPTKGTGTDIRAWWPACRRYQQQEES